MPNTLLQTKQLGQRLWLDNLSRDLLNNGYLQRLITEDGIAGLTSNPAIFYKAISESPAYQAPLAALKNTTLDAEARYESLVLPDIQAACDLFLPQFDPAGSLDGYVSLEVSPALAHDTQGTIDAAKRLWAHINRPNLMIKVPATPAGIAALKTLIFEGINVNVTLIFSHAQAQAVFDAYQAGLLQRATWGYPLHHVRSVASVFLSRIDVLVDKKLHAIGTPEALALCGKAAIANAKITYQTAKNQFGGAAFSPLAAQGAQAQYLLWASTATKNPAYSDVMYLDELIGENTVNTVPDATLVAFKDHGTAEATLNSHIDAAQHIIQQLAAMGVDLNQVGEQLQTEGLALFDEAFEKLLRLMAP